MKIAVGMICFNSMPFIEGALACALPYASQVFVVEGPVKYWQERGFAESTDGTVEAAKRAGKKVKIIRGRWKEKDEMHNAYVRLVADDTDYLWIVDPDELYRAEDAEAILSLLAGGGYDAAAIPWLDFVGGFDRCVDSGIAGRVRFLRWQPGARFAATRPPQPTTAPDILEKGKLLAGKALAGTGVRMFHYGHVFQHQVAVRAAYYQHRGIGYNVEYLARKAESFKGGHPAWIVKNKEKLLKKYG